MSEKRPKDMTHAELKALPIGPYREIREPITLEDIERGLCGKYKIRLEAMDVVVEPYRGDDIIGAWIDGRCWTFGRLRDGSWFRQMSFL